MNPRVIVPVVVLALDNSECKRCIADHDQSDVERVFLWKGNAPILVDIVKDVYPLMVGGFIYPFSEFATPKDQLVKRLGYQEDPAAAKRQWDLAIDLYRKANARSEADALALRSGSATLG